MSEGEKKKNNQFLLVKGSIKLGHGQEFAKLREGSGKSWQKWLKCF